MARSDEVQENELYKLLIRATPENRHGNKTISHLASLIGVSRWAIYKWIDNEHIRPERVKDVVDIAEGRVTISDFERFVYNF